MFYVFQLGFALSHRTAAASVPLSSKCRLVVFLCRWRRLRSGWEGHGGVGGHGAVAVWADRGWPDPAEGEDGKRREDSRLPHPPASRGAGFSGSEVWIILGSRNGPSNVNRRWSRGGFVQTLYSLFWMCYFFSSATANEKLLWNIHDFDTVSSLAGAFLCSVWMFFVCFWEFLMGFSASVAGQRHVNHVKEGAGASVWSSGSLSVEVNLLPLR